MTTLVAILLFTVIWIAPEMLLNTIRKVLEGGYSVKTAILVLLYELPKYFRKSFSWDFYLVHCSHLIN